VPAPDFAVDDHSASSFSSGDSPTTPCLACHPGTARSLSFPFTHLPAAEDGCTACHDPHGSASPFLLVAPFPRETLTVYRAGKYDLCWKCHEETLASEKFTSSSTSFRRGKRNFHYSHLHKRRGGMSCRACHDPHGTLQESLVRFEGPSGDAAWKSGMTFLREEAGGRCVGGCHKDIRYRR
jgi:predicted CXXCH cytochrome family protein